MQGRSVRAAYLTNLSEYRETWLKGGRKEWLGRGRRPARLQDISNRWLDWLSLPKTPSGLASRRRIGVMFVAGMIDILVLLVMLFRSKSGHFRPSSRTRSHPCSRNAFLIDPRILRWIGPERQYRPLALLSAWQVIAFEVGTSWRRIIGRALGRAAAHMGATCNICVECAPLGPDRLRLVI